MSSFLSAVFCTSFLSVASVAADTGDVGASERVNFSGKLRMLSQRVAAAACNYNAGIAKEHSLSVLVGAQSEFAKIVKGLEFGDVDLKMNGEETRGKTVHAIHALSAEWEGLSLAIDKVISGDDAQSGILFVNQNNMMVLSYAKTLVSEISGQYSNPFEMVQANSLLVDFSGRQRMLTQKMSKESCQVWNGDEGAAENLAGTMQMFEATLMALRGGKEGAGIKAAPTTEIFSGLSGIWNDWIELKPTLNKAVANEPVDEALRAEVFEKLNVMLFEMNEVVGLYASFARAGV